MRNKNLVVLTPFYPILHRSDLYEDTKAIFYLIKEASKENNVLVIHIYMHRFRKVLKNILKVIPLKREYSPYLHKDFYGNNVLFLESLLLIPKKDIILNYFNSRFSNIIKQYCLENEFNPDIAIIHFPTYYRNLLNKLDIFSKKMAILHAVDIKKIKKSKNINKWEIYFNQFDTIGFRSYAIKKEFEKIINYKNNKFVCLSGIPQSLISKNNLIKKSYKNGNDRVKIIYAGRLDKNKNINSIVEALYNIKDYINFDFSIFGEGPEEKNIKNQIKKFKLEDSIKIHKYVNRNDLFTMMKESDIFIMVSIKETLGLVYLEAMAAGCIVIGSKGQGIDGIINNGENGFLCEASNITDITQTILKVIKLSEKEQYDIRFKSYETIKKMDEEAISIEYLNNIRETLGV